MTKTCTQCGNEFETDNHKRKTCGEACRYKSVTMYTEADKAYMAEHYGKKSSAELMLYFGLDKPDTLRKLAGYWRKQGYPIPELRQYNIGDLVHRIDKGRRILWSKTANGWERVKKVKSARVADAKPKKIIKEKRIKVVKDSKPISQSEQADARRLHRKQQLQAQRLPTRVIDLSAAQRVYIPELRMHVYVKQGRTEAEVRAYWLEHHQFMGKRHAANSC